MFLEVADTWVVEATDDEKGKNWADMVKHKAVNRERDNGMKGLECSGQEG